MPRLSPRSPALTAILSTLSLSIFVDAFLRAPVCTKNMGSFGLGRCPLSLAHVRPYTCRALNASGVMNAR